VKLLERINHSRAGEFAAEARAYREAFTKALQEKAASMPTWKDARNRTHNLVPVSLSAETKKETRNAFYLDTGPLFLVFSGLLEASDDLMCSTVLWFREGPPAKVYRYDSNCWQVPSLFYEMSSCEPCYSSNFFHSHQIGDRIRFLQGMYSQFAGSLSRQTFSRCETRGGITGLSPNLPAFYGARLAVIDDQLSYEELHLLRLVPLAWLKQEAELTFQNVPTEFGVISVQARLARNGRELQLSYTTNFRVAPKRVILHVPPIRRLSRVLLNGRDLNWDGTAPTIAIS